MNEYFNHEHEMQMWCDKCDDESIFVGEYSECINEAKTEGWRIYKDADELWCHICPMCVYKENNATEVFK